MALKTRAPNVSNKREWLFLVSELKIEQPSRREDWYDMSSNTQTCQNHCAMHFEDAMKKSDYACFEYSSFAPIRWFAF